MPTGAPQTIAMMPGQINVPAANGLFISVSVSTDGTPEALAALPPALQSIIDLFQDWPGKWEGADVTGQLYDVALSSVTPTNPVPLPDPPVEDPDPNDLVAGDEEAPSTVV